MDRRLWIFLQCRRLPFLSRFVPWVRPLGITHRNAMRALRSSQSEGGQRRRHQREMPGRNCWGKSPILFDTMVYGAA